MRDDAFALPWVPEFLHKRGGLLLSLGQFNQWVASQLLASGFVQIWPGTPVAEPLFADRAVAGLRLADQGVSKQGEPAEGYMPGMDVQARLTVVGDGAVGAVGQAIDEVLGTPKGHARRDWALGMKFLIELPEAAAGEDAGQSWSRERSGTRLGILSRRSSASSTPIPTGWYQWGLLCRRGCTIRRGQRIDTCSTSFSIRRCGAI